MSAAPDWLSVERGDGAADRQHSPCGDRARRLRGSLRRRMAGAPRRRLAHPSALRFRALARRDDRQNRAVALAHRRQPRSERRVALSRPGDDRALPDDDLRRRAALSPGRSARGARDRRPAAALFRTLSRRARRRDRAAARRASARRALRRALDPFAHSAPVRRRAAGLQPRDQFRGELRSRFARARRRAAGGERRAFRRRRALQGRLDHAALRATGGRRPRPANGARLPRLHGRAGARQRSKLADPARRIPRRSDPRDAEARARGGAGMDPQLMRGAFRRFPSPLAGEGGRRSRPDEGSRRKARRNAGTREGEKALTRRPLIRRPFGTTPSPARGEGGARSDRPCAPLITRKAPP